MNAITNAIFGLDSYRFTQFMYNNPTEEPKNLRLSLVPSGVYNRETRTFILTIDFGVVSETDFVLFSCSVSSNFIFEENISKDEIPAYFYVNSIAIIFPYLRAFISTVTILAGVKQIHLPLLNLTGFQDELIENTIEV